MSFTCPNIGSPEWQELVDEIGEDRAWALWDEYSRNVTDKPSLFDEEPEDKLDRDLINLYKQQMKSLENRRKELKGEFNVVKRSEIYTRMEVIKSSMKRLASDVSYNNIINVAIRDMRDADFLLKKTNLSSKEILYVKNTLDRLIMLDELIPKEKINAQELARLQYLRTNSNELLRKWNIENAKLIESISISEGRPSKFEDLIAPVKDISAAKTYFLGLDTTHIPILRLMDSMFETVKRKTNTVMFEFNKKLAEIKKKYNTKEDFKGLLDETGRLITETKGSYFDEAREMEKRISLALENTISPKAKALLYRERDAWYKERNNYELTQEGKDLYEERLLAITDSLKDENGEISEDDEKYIAKWVNQNSPYLGLQYATGMIDKYAPGNIYWYRYLNQSPKDAYKNKDYEKVKDNELYKFVVSSITEGMKKIPHRMTVDLNSFDKVLNSILFDFNKENKFILRSAYEGVGDFMKDTFTRAITQQDVNGYSGKIVDERGSEKRKLYPKSITELQQEKEFKNPIELVSEFFNLATAYEHKSEIEPAIWLLNELLSKQSKVKTSEAGIPIKDKGVLSVELGGLSNAKSIAMTNILAELYGKRRVDIENLEPTDKEKKEFRILHEEWKKNKKEAIKNGTPIPKEPVLHKVSGIKAIDAVVDWTRLNLLWLKPISAISNLLIGIQGNFLHAGRNTDFNDAELFSAIRILGNSTLNYLSFGSVNTPDATKIRNLSNLMGIAEESFIEDPNSYTSKIAKFGLTWQTSGEYLIANQIMIAKMLREKIKNINGEEKTLWSAFNADGSWNEVEFGPLNELYLKKVKDRIREVRKQTQGDYQNVMQIKGTVAGRVLMLFRTWLPRAVQNRFGEQVGDEFKGRYITYRDVYQSYVEENGFWKGIGKMSASQMLVTLTKIANVPGFSQLGMNSLSELCNEKYEKELKKLGLSDLDIQNMRVNIRELQYLVYMSLILLTLGAMAKGGPPDKELTTSINLGTRIYQDMSFFYSFNSATSITKDPIPIYKTIQDGYAFVGNGINYIEDPKSDVYLRGRHEGGSKTEQSLYKLLPGLSAYQSTLNTMSQVFTDTGKHTSK